MPRRLSTQEVAQRAGVTPQTLRRWVRAGLVPGADGSAWSPAEAAHARIVARLRGRGHSIEQIRTATSEGRLAFGYLEDLLPGADGELTLRQAAKETGLEPALITRIYSAMGFSTETLERISEEDLQFLGYAAATLAAGLPLVAFEQLCRVYGQALAQIADAEVRLFHIYVHEPLMRDGVPGLEMAEAMEGLARELIPLASPIMDHVHQRFLQHFVEQDVIGHMEMDLAGAQLDLGRLRVAIAFADLAGYTRLTEEQGEEEAVGAVERFVEAVERTLPEDARVVKTIGDEVMIVGQDPRALCEWAVGFQALFDERPAPRIGVHSGAAIYRDGDYLGREVNLAARVVARARGSEVLITDAVRETVERLDHLEFEDIGQVKLKGFSEPRVLSLAMQAPEGRSSAHAGR